MKSQGWQVRIDKKINEREHVLFIIHVYFARIQITQLQCFSDRR